MVVLVSALVLFFVILGFVVLFALSLVLVVVAAVAVVCSAATAVAAVVLGACFVRVGRRWNCGGGGGGGRMMIQTIMIVASGVPRDGARVRFPRFVIACRNCCHCERCSLSRVVRHNSCRVVQKKLNRQTASLDSVEEKAMNTVYNFCVARMHVRFAPGILATIDAPTSTAFATIRT